MEAASALPFQWEPAHHSKHCQHPHPGKAAGEWNTENVLARQQAAWAPPPVSPPTTPDLPGDTGQRLPVLAPELSTPELCVVQGVTLKGKMGAKAAINLPTIAGALSAKTP